MFYYFLVKELQKFFISLTLSQIYFLSMFEFQMLVKSNIQTCNNNFYFFFYYIQNDTPSTRPPFSQKNAVVKNVIFRILNILNIYISTT